MTKGPTFSSSAGLCNVVTADARGNSEMSPADSETPDTIGGASSTWMEKPGRAADEGMQNPELPACPLAFSSLK